MNAQGSLFDVPIQGRARKSDPEGSHAAARICNAESEKGRILAALQVSWHSMTVAELEAATGIHRQHVSTRLPVLERAGLVQRAGSRFNERGVPVQQWAWRTPGTVDVQVTGERL